jgi:hypothetical protein
MEDRKVLGYTFWKKDWIRHLEGVYPSLGLSAEEGADE